MKIASHILYSFQFLVFRSRDVLAKAKFGEPIRYQNYVNTLHSWERKGAHHCKEFIFLIKKKNNCVLHSTALNILLNKMYFTSEGSLVVPERWRDVRLCEVSISTNP